MIYTFMRCGSIFIRVISIISVGLPNDLCPSTRKMLRNYCKKLGDIIPSGNAKNFFLRLNQCASNVLPYYILLSFEETNLGSIVNIYIFI